MFLEVPQVTWYTGVLCAVFWLFVYTSPPHYSSDIETLFLILLLYRIETPPEKEHYLIELYIHKFLLRFEQSVNTCLTKQSCRTAEKSILS